MIEAGKQFRRVNGHLHLPKLRAALDAYGLSAEETQCLLRLSGRPLDPPAHHG